MPKEKICEKLIVETIRELRWDRKNPKSGTISGMAFQRMFHKMLETHGEEQVCSALENLVRQGTIVITARMHEVVNNTEMSSHRKPGTSLQCIKKIPLHIGALPCWCLNEFEERVDPRKTDAYKAFKEVRVYIVADGLPQCVVSKCMKKTERSVP